MLVNTGYLSAEIEVGICWCHGNLMRSSLRGKAISKVWELYLLRNNVSNSNLSSGVPAVGIHGQAISANGARPWNCQGGLEIRDMAYTCVIPLLHSSISSSIFPDPELDSSSALCFTRNSMLPCSCLLGFGIQIRVRKYRSSTVHWLVLLVKCNLAWFLHEIVSLLWENSLFQPQGCFLERQALLSLWNSFCCNALVSHSFWLN